MVSVSLRYLSVSLIPCGVRVRDLNASICHQPRPRPRGSPGSIGDPSPEGPRMHLHAQWRVSVGDLMPR
jgi:hypothetical protein